MLNMGCFVCVCVLYSYILGNILSILFILGGIWIDLVFFMLSSSSSSSHFFHSLSFYSFYFILPFLFFLYFYSSLILFKNSFYSFFV